METIKTILKSNNLSLKKALFSFTVEEDNNKILLKYNLWIRHFFPKYFTSKDAEFHKQIDLYNLKIYKGELKSFVDIAFRGAAKTSRTKLFVGFVIANDTKHYRKYMKCISADGDNSKQITTDIYNMFVQPRVKQMYPEIFAKTNTKREETMSSFTTATGVKIVAGTVGTDQRGALQDEARPDFIWFEDFENRKTLHSARITMSIWDNMEEARTSLSRDGGAIYTCNYISEMGNVHKLVTKLSSSKKVLIIPIIENGIPTWDRYSVKDIEQMREDDDDFEGERLCQPSASKDIMFDREVLDNMKELEPIKVSAGFRIYKEYDPSDAYGSGHDVAGGVRLDSSASTFIDFDTIPARVVGTFDSNSIQPEVFGDEISREQDIFGGCIAGIENNYGTEAILKAKQNGSNLFKMPQSDEKIEKGIPTKYGWNTNSNTKGKMIRALVRAVNKGHLTLSDPRLISEAKSYTRNDLIEVVKDPRLTTRHFDLLISCAIAWQMKDYAIIEEVEEEVEEEEPLYSEIGI